MPFGVSSMTRNPNEIDQAVSRTLRDSLEKLQRTTDELNHAVNDLVSACASSRPTNSLPPMLRAQTAAASLSASLEVLSRFVTSALQPPWRTEAEQIAVEPLENTAPVITEAAPEREPQAVVAQQDASLDQEEITVVEEPAVEALDPAVAPSSPEVVLDLPAEPESEPEPAVAAAPPLMAKTAPEPVPSFDVSGLALEQRELHRRADRVAKVAMQDIKMLRPNEVKLGREHKDLCTRLQDDIEKAHKEYDRRFHAILDHPVDYFYKRMVEILGGGDADALGKYPYPSPVLRR